MLLDWSNSNLGRTSGCHEDLCVGDTALTTTNKSLKVKVLGIRYDRDFIIEFLEGNERGDSGDNWSRSKLEKI